MAHTNKQTQVCSKRLHAGAECTNNLLKAPLLWVLIPLQSIQLVKVPPPPVLRIEQGELTQYTSIGRRSWGGWRIFKTTVLSDWVHLLKYRLVSSVYHETGYHFPFSYREYREYFTVNILENLIQNPVDQRVIFTLTNLLVSCIWTWSVICCGLRVCLNKRKADLFV